MVYQKSSSGVRLDKVKDYHENVVKATLEEALEDAEHPVGNEDKVLGEK